MSDKIIYQLEFTSAIKRHPNATVSPQRSYCRHELCEDGFLELYVVIIAEYELGWTSVGFVTPRYPKLVAGVDQYFHPFDDIAVDHQTILFQFLIDEVAAIDDAHLLEECALSTLAGTK